MAHHPTQHRRAAALAGVLLVAALIAACSGTSPSTSSAGSQGAAGGSTGAVATQPGAGKAAAPVGTAGGSAAVDQVVAAERKITRTASLSVRVQDVARAAATVRGIAAAADGFVLSEQLGNDGGPQPVPDPGPQAPFGGFGTISVSVPTQRLDAVLDQLSRVGTVLSRTTSSQDVTDQYVDTQSRVKTMTASLDRVRALLAKATTIGQVISLESELTRREADLEALQAQLAALKGSVALSTVTVTLSTAAHAPVPASGFLAGLRAGWRAFQASATGLLTALGAVLPFAALALLVLVPLARWQRHRRRSPVSESPAPAGPAAP